MERTLCYVVDVRDSEPIMLINGRIGKDKDGNGVDCAKFQEELLFLDTLGKKRIRIHINSIGGEVYAGYSICSAILKTKTIVDTYNVGICASMAMSIYLMGRTRYWSDYSIGMIHNPAGGADKELSPITESLRKTIVSRTGLDDGKVSQMMNEETWFTSDEAKEMGICTVIENTYDLNIPRLKKTDNAEANFEKIKNIIASAHQPKSIQMSEVTALLNLSEAASEKAIAAEVKSIQASVEAKNTEITNLKSEVTKKEGEITAVKTELDSVKAELATVKTEKENALKAEAKVKGVELIKAAVKDGKVENKKESIEAWEAKAESDFAGTEALLKSIPMNKKAEKIEVGKVEGASHYNMAVAMAEINEKAKAKK